MLLHLVVFPDLLLYALSHPGVLFEQDVERGVIDLSKTDRSSVNDVHDLIDAARSAGDLLRAGFGRASVVSQVGRDIKLDEDARSQALIVARLQAASDYPILTEESGWIGIPPNGDEPYWVVDPLDGSFNYQSGTPLCCTSVALCRGMRPVAGAIYDFLNDQMFHGGPGLGLFLNDAPLIPPTGQPSVFATGFPIGGNHAPEALARQAEGYADWRKIRMIGTAGLSLAWVASGRFDAYAESAIRWWDVAGGLALVLGGGGEISIEGERPDGLLTVRAGRMGAYADIGRNVVAAKKGN